METDPAKWDAGGTYNAELDLALLRLIEYTDPWTAANASDACNAINVALLPILEG